MKLRTGRSTKDQTRSKYIYLYFIVIALFSLLFNSVYAESIKNLVEKLKKQPQQTRIREALAKKYILKKQYKNAVDLLAAYSNEISREGLIDLAQAYEGQNDRLNEIRTLNLLIEKDPDHFRPRFILGTALKKDGKLNEAAENFRKSIEMAPQHRPSYDSLLEIFIETKQNYESRVLIGDMIKKFGQKNEFLNLLCKLYATDNFLVEAIDMCKKAVSQNPKFPDNHVYLAQTYYNQGNKATSDKIFQTAGRQFIKSEFVQYATGEYYLNEKNYATSVRYLKNAVKINAQSLRANITLAKALYETQDYKSALLYFEKSCALDKSKETMTEIRTAAAKLRQKNESSMAEQYDRKAAVCQR